MRRLLAGIRGLVEVLVEGYTLLNRRLWVLLLPVGLDLFLWLGPRISPQRPAEAVATMWEGMAAAAASSPGVDPQVVQRAAAALRTWGEQTNLNNLLSAYLIPLLLPRLSLPALPAYTPPVWTPATGWVLLPLPFLALALGLLSWTLYMAPIADLVRESSETGLAMLRRVGVTWGRLLVLLGLALVALGLFLGAAGLLLLLLAPLSASLAVLILYMALGGLFGVLFHLYFTPQALLLSGVGPRRGLFYSLQTVRSAPWVCLGFIALSLLIRAGTALLWQRLAVWPWGVLAGILCNAYISGGVVAATFLFFRERLQEWLARVRAR